MLKARDYSLKILSNSFYGYLGFPASRWYSLACAASITAFGRKYLNDVVEKARQAGLDVVYGDTDSCFLSLGGENSKKDALDFIASINKTLPSLMELELQGFYPRGLFVMKKGESRGAKKKYALIDEDLKIKVVGFETIRGDWSILAKEVQNKVIEIALVEQDKTAAFAYVKDIIGNIRAETIPLEKMVIQKQLRKLISSYESVGPHVQVAKRMEAQGKAIGPGAIVKYVIERGKGSIGERARLLEEAKNYDADYYVKNQILPVVGPILEVLGFDKQALEQMDQKQLGDF